MIYKQNICRNVKAEQHVLTFCSLRICTNISGFLCKRHFRSLVICFILVPKTIYLLNQIFLQNMSALQFFLFSSTNRFLCGCITYHDRVLAQHSRRWFHDGSFEQRPFWHHVPCLPLKHENGSLRVEVRGVRGGENNTLGSEVSHMFDQTGRWSVGKFSDPISWNITFFGI